jgi:hypothetical protein
MDMLSIMRTILRHKLATVPVVLLVIIGVVYVMALKQPIYQSTGSYLLMAPPAPPTAGQIAADPSLAKVNTNNPFTSYGDLSIVAELLTQQVGSDAVKAQLVRDGAQSTYTVSPSQQFGLTTPLMQVSATGPTAASAIQTAALVGKELAVVMRSLQVGQKVDPRYSITTFTVTAPLAATLELSSKLRMLVGVFAVGLILMFVVVSTMKAMDERKQSVTGWPWEEMTDPFGDALLTEPRIATSEPPLPHHASSRGHPRSVDMDEGALATLADATRGPSDLRRGTEPVGDQPSAPRDQRARWRGLRTKGGAH